MQRRLIFVFVVILVFSVSIGSRAQQTTTGVTTGLVTNTSGAAIAGAHSQGQLATTIVGVKLLKAKLGEIARPLQVELPPRCMNCSVLHGSFYEGQNAHEVFFYLKVPVKPTQIANVKVDVGNLQIRAVVVEKTYLRFSKKADLISFDLPVVPRERSSTLELQTNLDWPGLTVRIEHAFEDRRAGAYATGTWPAVERQAALNLEFGLREAIRELKLDREVCDRDLGRIHLMGFDTNFPLGHEDFPPHIHIILRWPHFAGSQAPHFYISSAGLLEGRVKVTIDGMPQIAATFFAQGEPVPAIDFLGETLYQVVEDQNGGLTLQRSGKISCTLQPPRSSPPSFGNGAVVSCGTGQPFLVTATDDVKAGILKVSVGSKPMEIYKYDPDTAVLLSATPALPAGKTAACGGISEIN